MTLCQLFDLFVGTNDNTSNEEITTYKHNPTTLLQQYPRSYTVCNCNCEHI